MSHLLVLSTIMPFSPVASEQNQHCGGKARPEGLKLEARRAEPGVGFLGRGGKPPLLPQWGPGWRPGRQEFGCIWGSSGELQVSSPAPAVLLLDLGVIHSSFCGSACKFSGWLAGSSHKIWLLWLERTVKQYTNELRGFGIAGARVPIAPAVPTPLVQPILMAKMPTAHALSHDHQVGVRETTY